MRPSDEWYRRKNAEIGENEPAVIGAGCAAPAEPPASTRLAEELDSIERAITRGDLNAYQVFTMMRRKLPPLSALRAKEGGFVRVPVEPTWAIRKAIWAAFMGEEGWHGGATEVEQVDAIYRAALAAAPREGK